MGRMGSCSYMATFLGTKPKMVVQMFLGKARGCLATTSLLSTGRLNGHKWAQMPDIGDFNSAERPEVKYEELAP